eukprot:gene12235-14329_t
MSVPYEEALNSLHSMFSSFDRELIGAVLQENKGHMEKTIDSLLEMSGEVPINQNTDADHSLAQMEQDEMLARMMQNELFMNEIRNDEDFATLFAARERQTANTNAGEAHRRVAQPSREVEPDNNSYANASPFAGLEEDFSLQEIKEKLGQLGEAAKSKFKELSDYFMKKDETKYSSVNTRDEDDSEDEVVVFDRNVSRRNLNINGSYSDSSDDYDSFVLVLDIDKIVKNKEDSDASLTALLQRRQKQTSPGGSVSPFKALIVKEALKKQAAAIVKPDQPAQKQKKKPAASTKKTKKKADVEPPPPVAGAKPAYNPRIPKAVPPRPTPRHQQTPPKDETYTPSPRSQIYSSPFKPKGLFEVDPFDDDVSQHSDTSFEFDYNDLSQLLRDAMGPSQQGGGLAPPMERLVAVSSTYEHLPPRVGKNPVHRKTVRAINEATGAERTIVMYSDWVFTRIAPGDLFNVIGIFDETGAITLEARGSNLLVLHPDLLITGTELGGSFSCSRRALLKEQVTSEPSTVPLYGSIVHEIFQSCLATNRYQESDCKEFAKEVLLRPSFALKLSSLGETHEGATLHVAAWIPAIVAWGAIFVDVQNSSANIIEFSGKRWHLQITKVLDIEENIWSPMFGLKGKIDATVEVKLTPPFVAPKRGKSPPKKNQQPQPQLQQQPIYLNVPLEIKTGKAYESPYITHTSQVLIYTLMMNDRYRQETQLGLLYYLKNENEKVGKKFGLMHPVLPDRNSIRSLVVARNLLVYYLFQNSRLVLNPNPVLPKMLREERTCGRCYFIDPCLLHHKAVENGDRNTSGLGDLFDERTTYAITSIYKRSSASWKHKDEGINRD